MDRITVVLGVPPKALQPNSRCHWAQKARAKAQARYDAHIATLSALDGRDPPQWTHARIAAIRWYGARAACLRMDRDNAIATLKASQDGMTDAGLFADDHGVSFAADIPVFAVDKANPRVEVDVEPRAIYERTDHSADKAQENTQ